MTNLNCSVSNCANYDNSLCGLNSIQVNTCSVNEATHRDETFCKSYSEKVGAPTNFVSSSSPMPETEIRCTASTCYYNSSASCTAPSITVQGDGKTDPKETRCSTFRAK